MMGSYSDAEEDQFFDTRDGFASITDLGSDCSEDCSTSGHVNHFSDGFGFDFWAENLESAHERRDRFLRLMGLSSEWHPNERGEIGDVCFDDTKVGIGRLRENTEPMLANLDLEDGSLCSRSSSSCLSNEALEVVQSGVVEGDIMDKIRNLDDGAEPSVDELVYDELIKRLSVVDADQLAMAGSPYSVQRSSREEAETGNLFDRRKKVKKSWLQKLSVVSRISNRQQEAILKPNSIKAKAGASSHTVRVHSHRKQSKELSSLYAGQDFLAHKGSILTMKFSPDGQYLASGGEDGIVRVWKVIEDERPSKFETRGTDPSCLYFSINHLSELAPLDVDKDENRKITRLRKSSESACVIYPHKVFRILEKPVHEFHGHGGDILALSWSQQGYLLSSSVDKTVRMWQVGLEQCLKVFSHNNYVTCIEFNPVDDNYFISGSIDGKVRIWEVHSCRVIDWIDIIEIVTAVCYRPNGKGGIVGSIDGNCSFYDIIDNRLQLGAQICLMGKKKLPAKRITGFQFCPSDLSKVVVTSADSKVRILSGVNLISKFKGSRSSGTQMSASFTADGKHIVSAAEDSNVYVWNHISSVKMSSKAKTIMSCENFLCQNASIAIPWCGMKFTPVALPSPTFLANDLPRNTRGNGNLPRMPLSSPGGFFLESLCKGSPTWPAETLPDSSQVSVSPSLHKSEYKFLKSAYQSTFVSPHMWGLVIVTAGWDGRIRTYLNYGLPIHL